jgi:hypothetical protein
MPACERIAGSPLPHARLYTFPPQLALVIKSRCLKQYLAPYRTMHGADYATYAYDRMVCCNASRLAFDSDCNGYIVNGRAIT